MISREHLDRILWLAVHAPSGDNAQPWRFEVKGGVVDIFNVTGKDNSPYNYKEFGSYFAHGALIENISIAASVSGYRVEADIDESQADHIASIRFFDEKIPEDSLVDLIESRATNRKPYKKISLTAEHKDGLLRVAKEKMGEVRLIEDQKAIARIGRIISVSDRLIFENRYIHDAIFGSIRWTEEEEAKHSGMYAGTLELPPPGLFIFRLLRNWPMAERLNHVNIAKFIASQSAKNHGSSSAIGMVLIPRDGKNDFVEAGRLFERMWLTATQIGVRMQPITAISYLANRVNNGVCDGFSEEQVLAIKKADGELRRIFNAPSETIAMIFRAGYANPPSAHSLKSQPQITYLD